MSTLEEIENRNRHAREEAQKLPPGLTAEAIHILASVLSAAHGLNVSLELTNGQGYGTSAYSLKLKRQYSAMSLTESLLIQALSQHMRPPTQLELPELEQATAPGLDMTDAQTDDLAQPQPERVMA